MHGPTTLVLSKATTVVMHPQVARRERAHGHSGGRPVQAGPGCRHHRCSWARGSSCLGGPLHVEPPSSGVLLLGSPAVQAMVCRPSVAPASLPPCLRSRGPAVAAGAGGAGAGPGAGGRAVRAGQGAGQRRPGAGRVPAAGAWLQAVAQGGSGWTGAAAPCAPRAGRLAAPGALRCAPHATPSVHSSPLQVRAVSRRQFFVRTIGNKVAVAQKSAGPPPPQQAQLPHVSRQISAGRAVVLPQGDRWAWWESLAAA